MVESGYDYKITLKKYGVELGILLGITGLTYVVDNILPDIQISYPEYAGIIIVVTPMVVALLNYLKHRKDINLKSCTKEQVWPGTVIHN